MEPTGRALAGFVNPSQQKVEDDSEDTCGAAKLSGWKVQKKSIDTCDTNIPSVEKEILNKELHFEAGSEKQDKITESRRQKKNRRKKDNNRKVSVAAATDVPNRAGDLFRPSGRTSPEVRKTREVADQQLAPSWNDLQDIIGKPQQVTGTVGKVSLAPDGGEPGSGDARHSPGMGASRDVSQFMSLPQKMLLPTSIAVKGSEGKLQYPHGPETKLAAVVADHGEPSCEEQHPKGGAVEKDTTPAAMQDLEDNDAWETVSAGRRKLGAYKKKVTAKEVIGMSRADPGIDSELLLLSKPLKSISKEDYDKCADHYEKDERRFVGNDTYEKFKQLVAMPLEKLPKGKKFFLIKIFRRLLRNTNYSEAVLANSLYLQRRHNDFMPELNCYYPIALLMLCAIPDPDYQLPDVIMDCLIGMFCQCDNNKLCDVLGWSTMGVEHKASFLVSFAIIFEKKGEGELLTRLVTDWVTQDVIDQWISTVKSTAEMAQRDKKADFRSILPNLTNGILRWIYVNIKHSTEDQRLKWANYFIKTSEQIETSLEGMNDEIPNTTCTKRDTRKIIIWTEMRCFKDITKVLPKNQIYDYLTRLLSYVKQRGSWMTHRADNEGRILKELCFSTARHIEHELMIEKSTCTGKELEEKYQALTYYKQELEELASKDRTQKTRTKLNFYVINDPFSKYNTAMLESIVGRLRCMLHRHPQKQARENYQHSVRVLRSLDEGKYGPNSVFFKESITLEIARWYYLAGMPEDSKRELVGLDYDTPEMAIKKAALLSHMHEFTLASHEFNRVLEMSDLKPRLIIKATAGKAMALLNKYMAQKIPERDTNDLSDAYQILTAILKRFPDDKHCEGALMHVIDQMHRDNIDFHSHKLWLPEEFRDCRAWDQIGRVLHARHKSKSTDMSAQAAKEASKTKYPPLTKL